jgi:Icc protein
LKFIEVSETPFHELRYRSSGRGGEIRDVVLPFYRAIVDSLPKGVSSFVLTSDLQGRENDKNTNRLVGEAVAEELSLLCELGEIPKINFVGLAGDLYDYPEMHKLGGSGDVTSVWNAFAREFDLVIGVHGNHDIVIDSELAHNTVILDGTSTKLNGIEIGGVSGIIGRSDRNQRKSEGDFLKELGKVTNTKSSLILLHQGPEDTVNNQIGEPLITQHLENNGDCIVVFGHCHWNKPLVTIGKNQVLNVDNKLYVVSEANT